jgi:hypothetical protein
MEHDLDIDQRLRAARPRAARADAGAFDAALLARVREQPLAARRRVARAVVVPTAAVATLTVAAVVMLGGGPGSVGGPSSAAAITQALHWLTPKPGTILHARSVETQAGRTTTREVWQSGDDPAIQRIVIGGAQRFEISGDAVYDPATDTIYDPQLRTPSKGGDVALPAGDPIVQKVRFLLEHGNMEVSGPAPHDGTSAFAISLKANVGRPAWTLWVSAADGRPLELRDPGRDAGEAPSSVRWSTYEVLPNDSAQALLSLTAAHPNARIVHDEARVTELKERLAGTQTESASSSSDKPSAGNKAVR